MTLALVGQGIEHDLVRLIEESGKASSTVTMYCGVIRAYLSAGAALGDIEATQGEAEGVFA